MASETSARPRRPDRTQLWVSLAALALGLLLTAPSYVWVMRVAGGSDAPTFIIGDRILVNRAAFDLYAPYTGIRLSEIGDPVPGDVVVLRAPESEHLITKRVVAGPGEVVRIEGGRVFIDGEVLGYEELPAGDFAWVPDENRPGTVFAREIGHGVERVVTFTPQVDPGFGPERVPLGHYFVLGDNRSNSTDSRSFGFVPRDRIQGKVVRRLSRGDRN